jgi:hydroxypyruvate isomerase
MELTVSIETTFTDIPFLDRLKKAADLGFKYVEMCFFDDIQNYNNGDPEELAKAAQDNNLIVNSVVIGHPDGTYGGHLTNPADRKKWIDRTKKTFDFTKKANIPAAVVCTGNVVEGMTEKQMFDSVMEGLKATVELAEKADMKLFLEPLNTFYDHPGYFLTSSDLGSQMVRDIGSKNLSLLFDIYHLQITEGDIINHIKNNIDVIGHFHSAGVPGRAELFDNEINYPFVISEIEKLDYKGLFGLEYFPKMKDHSESVKKVLKYIGRA